MFVSHIFNFVLDTQVSDQMPSFKPLTGKFWGEILSLQLPFEKYAKDFYTVMKDITIL